MKNGYIDGILECFLEIGIFVDETDVWNSTPLYELIPDSMTFIALVVGLEDKFGVEVPDEYLVKERLVTINDIAVMMELIS